ncbi:hypothetical protein AVEN_237646-1 [Araneus ventricosus]|uniref:Uncharacterized protein n=1 Tax=Araneus ventricosus TaxID=182803 RepID=A0A4Y2LE43_ARAVE|nr:hypothetical protein AVEN_237646-1 [Araneus ventricosus]
MAYKKSDENADCLIVSTAQPLASTRPSVVVIDVDARNRFLGAFYGSPTSTSDTPSLNNVLYKCCRESSFNKTSNMASLPPTEASVQPTFPKTLKSDLTLARQ